MSDQVLVTLLRYGFYNLFQFKTSGTYLLSKDRCFEFGLLVPQSFIHPAIIVHELEPKKMDILLRRVEKTIQSSFLKILWEKKLLELQNEHRIFKSN